MATFTQIFLRQKSTIQAQNLKNKKAAHIMLEKLTPGQTAQNYGHSGTHKQRQA